MSVVRRAAIRRWLAVGAGVTALCLLPAIVAAWPAGTAAGGDPDRLRDRILASGGRPYQGYVTTTGRLDLPPLPELAELTGLLGGSARVRAWYAGPTAWRVAELTATGERDTYRSPAGQFRWDFERNLVTHIAGPSPPVWLAGVPDLVPPTLARRLLAGDGRLATLPPRREAGVDAAGLRLVPTDPDTAVGRVDVWADPDTGLPVRVELAAGGGADAAFTARFLQLRQTAPDPAVVRPAVPAGAGLTVTTADEVGDSIAAVLPGPLPATLAGRPRGPATAAAGVAGGATYGTGFSTLVVLALPGRVGGRTLAAARDAGGTPVPLAGAEAYQLRASVLTTLVVRTVGPRGSRRGWLLTGLVEPDLLRRAATELVGTQ